MKFFCISYFLLLSMTSYASFPSIKLGIFKGETKSYSSKACKLEIKILHITSQPFKTQTKYQLVTTYDGKEIIFNTTVSLAKFNFKISNLETSNGNDTFGETLSINLNLEAYPFNYKIIHYESIFLNTSKKTIIDCSNLK